MFRHGLRKFAKHSTQSLNNAQELSHLMSSILPIVENFMEGNLDPEMSVIKTKTYEELKKDLKIELGDDGIDDTAFVDACERFLHASTRTGKSLFCDKLYAGSESTGQIAEFLLAILNSNCHTFPSHPAACAMEHYLINKCGRMFGYAKPDGIFLPGGSIANCVSMLCAREKYFPHVRKMGWQPMDNPVVITSQHDHYSVNNGVNMCGIGLANRLTVPCENGRMIPAALEETIEKAREDGKNPFYVNAMSGTTVLCAYDDLEAIGGVCKRQNVWFHVDGCIGGTLIFSNKYRDMLAGSRFSDSYTWNAHKLAGVALQCTLLAVKEKGWLHKACATGAEYLYHDTNPLNHGERTIQCGRKADAFKLWLFWKRYGRAGMEDRINKAMETTKLMAQKITDSPKFTLVANPQGTNVCFWYVPEEIRGTVRSKFLHPEDPHMPSILGDIAQKCRPIMLERGKVMIDVAPLSHEGMGYFFRMTCVAPSLTEGDLDFALEEITEIAEQILNEGKKTESKSEN